MRPGTAQREQKGRLGVRADFRRRQEGLGVHQKERARRKENSREGRGGARR